MRTMMGGIQVSLMRAVRAAIGADRWFDGWTGIGGTASLVIEEMESNPWASLTFSGQRHRMGFRLEGPITDVESAYDRLVALLTEPDISLVGHVLADMQLAESVGEIHPDGRMSLAILFEALTIEE